MTDTELRDAIKARIEDNTAVDMDFLLLEPLVDQLVILYKTYAKVYAAEDRKNALQRVAHYITDQI